jgi:phosphoglucosamine mutase
MGVEPNGININHEVGATDVRALQKRVVEENADLGLAFDGDGDRIIMVDHLGNKVDGDQIAYIIARDALRRGELKGGVVGTLMTNLGMENGLKQLGIPFVRAAVGDRYVMEKLLEKGWKIGAENSGHVILLDKVTTGDAIVAALQVLASVVGSSMTLHDLSQGMTLYPQVLENVRFSGDSNPLEADAVKQAVTEVENALGSKGRVLLRKSGTEPLLRVMVEGEDAELVTQSALKIADAVKASC